MMGDVFPELKENEKKIQDVIRDEEESFENTLAKVFLVSRRIRSTIAWQVCRIIILCRMSLCSWQINVYIVFMIVL